MFILFLISLSIIFYFICKEFDKPVPPETPVTGSCPECSAQVVSGWLVCPECKTILREACADCGKVHDSWVKYCPWCRHLNEAVKA